MENRRQMLNSKVWRSLELSLPIRHSSELTPPSPSCWTSVDRGAGQYLESVERGAPIPEIMHRFTPQNKSKNVQNDQKLKEIQPISMNLTKLAVSHSVLVQKKKKKFLGSFWTSWYVFELVMMEIFTNARMAIKLWDYHGMQQYHTIICFQN